METFDGEGRPRGIKLHTPKLRMVKHCGRLHGELAVPTSYASSSARRRGLDHASWVEYSTTGMVMLQH
jgi:hypothetical protein